MNWRGHVFFGFIFVALATWLLSKTGMVFDSSNIFFITVISFVYSQLPDLDTQASQIRWLLTTGLIAVALYFMYLNETIFATATLIALLGVWCLKMVDGGSHRGFIHTNTAGGLLALPLLMFNVQYFVLGIVAYSSHLLMDSKLSKSLLGWSSAWS